MFARVSTYEGRPEQLDEMHQEGMEHVLPALEMQDGFSGGLVLADRQSGKVLAVTLWESERWTLPRMPLTGCESSAPNPEVER
jgi:heme-degrading monooxygenase HmoA